MALLRRKVELESEFSNGRHARRPAGPWGTAHDGKRQQRALLASATNVISGGTTNIVAAKQIARLRQAWQGDAWAYRDSIGELRYATNYLGNAMRKIKFYPAAYVPDELDPVALDKIPDCPDEVIAAATDAMLRLAANPLAMGGLARDTAENFEVAGECWLIGWPPGKAPSGDNDDELWEIRSVNEVKGDAEGRILVKEEGMQGQGEPIPDGAFASRLWYPHPGRKSLADSPFAAILDLCEELLILSRDIRAAGRSRLANNGLLLLPDSLTVVKMNVAEDAQDDQQDEFMQVLIAAAQTAIQDEGSAAAIVPIIARGPKDDLAAVRQVRIERPEQQRSNDRTELIGRMATTLDLPAEVLTGKADLNHWTAWSVSDDTFSDHIEPLVIVLDDAFVAGYLRIMLKATEGVPPEWVNRVVMWHDATRLVRHPDRSQDALQAYDRFALSQSALRDTMGFSDTDAPPETEILERLVVRQTRLDPTIAAQIIKRMDSSLDISAVQAAPGTSTAQPGSSGAPTGPPAGLPSASSATSPTGGSAGGPPQGGQPQQEQPSPPPATASAYPKALTAATHIEQGSRKLGRIENDLMSKVLTAANGAMSRALEKAGARIRTQVSKTASGRAWCSSHKNIELPFIISNAMMAAAGLEEQQLLSGAWAQLKTEWETYMEDADSDTLNAMAKMLKVSPDALADKADVLSEYADSGWTWLEQRLNRLGHSYLSDAASLAGKDEEIATTELVDWGTIKQAISRAGGQPSSTSPGVTFGDDDPTTQTPMTGLTNGPIVSDTLGEGGLEISSYTWIHGTTANPFPPHEDLDGIEFGDWTDDVLANDGEFPPRDYYMPGDHDGCTCDFQVNWAGQEAEAEAEQGVAAGGQFYEGQPRAEGGKFGEGKQAGDEEPKSQKEQVDEAVNYGMHVATANRLYREGKLDEATTLSQKLAPQEEIDQSRQDAETKYQQAQAQISPEDKAAAEERHASSSRAGGDDRPDYQTRRGYCDKLVNEFGDGQTCPCVWCGRTLVADTVSLDRLVPGSEGGPYKMFNLIPTCYDCNNWRSDTAFDTTMKNALGAEKSTAASGITPAGDKPLVPLGTMVTAKCIGFGGDSEHASPDEPTGIPLEQVSGKLDGYYVGTFGYYKHIVAGYDVDPATIQTIEESEGAVAQSTEQ